MPSKITIESDSITIRRLFALNPATQAEIPPDQVPVIGSNGRLEFYSTIEYFSTISSATASQSVYDILSFVAPGFSSISSQTGELTSSLTSSLTDFTLSSFSSIIDTSVNISLVSTINGLGSVGYISSVFTNPYSISVYSFTLTDGVHSGTFTLSSPFLQLNNDYLPTSTSLISTVAGLGTASYISTPLTISEDFVTSSVKGYSLDIFGLQSTFNPIQTNQLQVNDIKYGDGYWLAAGTGTYLSSNVSDWILVDGTNAASIDYDNAGLWINSVPNYSADAFSWFPFSAGFINGTMTIQKVLYTPDGWFVGGFWTGAGSNNSSIMYSATGDDDTNWTAMEGGVGIDAIYSIAYGGGKYMASGSDSGGSVWSVITSTDGVTWQNPSSNPVGDSGDTIPRLATNSDGTIWLGVGSKFGLPALFRTDDFGANWTYETPFLSATAYNIQFKNNKFYVLYGDITSSILTSVDGITWTNISPPSLPTNLSPLVIEYDGYSSYVIGGATNMVDLNSTIIASFGSDTNFTTLVPSPYSSTVSTVLTTTVNGLVNVNDTVSSIVTESEVVSSVQGLATAGYISSLDFVSFTAGLGSFGFISTITSTVSALVVNYSTVSLDTNNISTAFGLSATGFFKANDGEIQYVSTFNSTVTGLDTFLNFTSTTAGLGSAGYVSSSQLVSSFSNLGPYGYISEAGLVSTVKGIDGFASIITSDSYLRIPSPYQSTNAFHFYTSTLVLDGTLLISTPSVTDKSKLFSTAILHIGGFHDVLLSTSKFSLEIPVNTSIQYHATTSQNVYHSWFLRDEYGLKRGDRTNFVTSLTNNSNIQYGSLKFQLDYHDIVNPFYASTYTLMLSTSAAGNFSTVITMNMASTSVIATLNNLNR